MLLLRFLRSALHFLSFLTFIWATLSDGIRDRVNCSFFIEIILSG